MSVFHQTNLRSEVLTAEPLNHGVEIDSRRVMVIAIDGVVSSGGIRVLLGACDDQK